MTRVIRPVILSGGTGTRLWPLSRESRPKQLLPLLGDRTMLQETVLRTAGRAGFGAPIVVAGDPHRFLVAEQLREIEVDASLLLEPVARNTAPAIAAAALAAVEDDADALLLVMPADHAVADPEALVRIALDASPAADTGRFVLFGVRPDRPATGYGYIETGEPLGGGLRAVTRFVEKPDLARAEAFVAGGRHLWNSGMFLLPAAAFLDEAARLVPGLAEAAGDAWSGARRELDFVRLDRAAFARAPAVSIDHGVMEHTELAVVAPADFGWADVGAWSALHEISVRDDGGVVSQGAVEALDCADSYLRSEGPLVAALGVRDLVVVATSDAVLVADRRRTEEVKSLVDALRRDGFRGATESPRTYRPWGWYERMDEGPGFQVKRIVVRPGARLSLQKHARRSEHWVVVSGAAEIVLGDERRRLGASESVFIPAGVEHRLANPTADDLHLIEVQTGDYLGEDDIVRLQDDYARA